MVAFVMDITKLVTMTLMLLTSYRVVHASDIYDVSTGYLTIPEVVTGSTKHFDLVISLKALIFGGDVTNSISTSSLSSRYSQDQAIEGSPAMLSHPRITLSNRFFPALSYYYFCAIIRFISFIRTETA